MKKFKFLKKSLKLVPLLSLICMAFIISACNSNSSNNSNNKTSSNNANGEMSFTFSVSTGDNVEIAINPKLENGKELTLLQYNGDETNIAYTSNKNNVLSNCSFILEDHYKIIVSRINDSQNTKYELLDKGTIKNNDENFEWYEYIDSRTSKKQINYVVWLKDGNTGILIKNEKDKKTADLVFNQLKFRLKNLN